MQWGWVEGQWRLEKGGGRAKLSLLWGNELFYEVFRARSGREEPFELFMK